MKYYRYLSGSKIDMLFPQVPHALREKVSAEIGFNFGVVSGSVGSEAPRFDDHVSRLQVVERYLRSSDAVGTIDMPLDWFEGEMSAVTVSFRTRGGAVFFVGPEERQLVMLGGSASNLLGARPSSSDTPPYSDLAMILGELEALMSGDVSEDDVRSLPLFSTEPISRRWDADADNWADLVWYIAHGQGNLTPPEDVHFLARKLAVGRSKEGHRVMLGTPLYVAGGRATEG